MPYFLKRKDRFGRIIFEGVAVVQRFQNETLISVSKTPLGLNCYYCRLLGGIVETKNGIKHRERYTFFVWDSHPCVNVVKNLQYGDYVFVCGIYKPQEYISSITGTKRQKRMVSIEFIMPFGNGVQNRDATGVYRGNFMKDVYKGNGEGEDTDDNDKYGFE